jgi:hypothetical protein
MKLYNTTLENFNNNYFGAVTLSIIGQSCLGGAAAMFVLKNGTSALQMVQLALIVFVSMFANTSILAQMSHKTILNFIIFSVFISVLLIFLNTAII